MQFSLTDDYVFLKASDLIETIRRKTDKEYVVEFDEDYEETRATEMIESGDPMLSITEGKKSPVKALPPPKPTALSLQRMVISSCSESINKFEFDEITRNE